nr:iron-containing alcohol dehydrogenase [Halomonas socia]
MHFDYGLIRSPGRILFGAGQVDALPHIAGDYGRKALLCTDARLGGSDLVVRIEAGLRQAGVEVRVFDGTEPELPVTCVYACANAHREFAPDVIIGLGGGSCLDLAKLVSLALSGYDDLTALYGEFKVESPTLPVIAIPTTSGTGSEVTPVAVLGDKDRALKVGISDPALIPDVAICDPELTVTCPPGLTAVSGIDALTHAIEAFTAMRQDTGPATAFERVFIGKNALSDHNALGAIRLMYAHLADAVDDGEDRTARAALMLGSTLAGLAFGSAGTSAAHAIQYPLGALTHTAHGLGIGILLPHVLQYNVKEAEDSFAEIARAISVAGSDTSNAEAAQALVQAVRELVIRIGLPRNLSAIGVTTDKVAWIAERSLDAARLANNNPRPLTTQGVAGILQAALDADGESPGKEVTRA